MLLDVPQMNEYLKRLIDSRVVTGGEGEQLPLHSDTSLDQCEFLQRTIDRVAAVHCVEVGLAYGISALAICDAVSQRDGASLTTIDPFQREAWKNIGRLNIERAGYADMVTHYEEVSQAVLPRLLGEGAEFDFAYIDTTKVFDAVLIDAYFATRLLRVGGVIVFDDCSWPGIRKVVRYITEWPHLSIFDTHKQAEVSRTRMAASAVSTAIPFADKILRPEIVRPDHALGVSAECVAFQKTAEDRRSWDWSVVPS